MDPSCHVARNVSLAWLTVLAFTPDCRSWRLDVKSRSGAAGRVSDSQQSVHSRMQNARLRPPQSSLLPLARAATATGAIQFPCRLHADVAAPCRASQYSEPASSAAPGAPRPCLRRGIDHQLGRRHGPSLLHHRSRTRAQADTTRPLRGAGAVAKLQALNASLRPCGIQSWH